MNSFFKKEIESLKKAFNNNESVSLTDGNYKNKSGNTILHYFIKYKNIINLINDLDLEKFILKKILEFDKNINLKNNDGYTPLMLAIKNEYVDIAHELLKIPSIDVNIQGPENNTALILTIRHDLDSIANELLEIPGIDLNLQGYERNTALILAIRNKKEIIVEKLLEMPGIIFDLQRYDGHTALMSLIMFYNEKNFNRLLEKDGIGINLRDRDGNTALTLAIICNKYTVSKYTVSKLLKIKDIDVNLQTRNRDTPLILAIKEKKPNICIELLKIPSIDVNIPGYERNTALMHSINSNYTDVSIELLKIKDIDVNLKNLKGYTALDIAREKRNHIVINIILLEFMDDINICIDKNLQEFINCICKFIIKKANKKNNNIKNDYDVYNIIIEYLKKNYNLEYKSNLGKVIIREAIKGEALLTFINCSPEIYYRQIQIEYITKNSRILSGINVGGLTRNFFFECQIELHELFSKKSINSNKIEYYNRLQQSIEWNNYIPVVNLLIFSKINNCPIYLDIELFGKLSKIVLNLIIIDDSYSLIQKIFIINILLKYVDILDKKLLYGMYQLLLTERHLMIINNTRKFDKKNIIATYISEINKTTKNNRNRENKKNMNIQINKFRNNINRNTNLKEVSKLLHKSISSRVYKNLLDFYLSHFISHIVTFETFMQNLKFKNDRDIPPQNSNLFIQKILKFLNYMNEKDGNNILLLAQTMTGNTLLAPEYVIKMSSTLTINIPKAIPAKFHTCFNSVDFYEDNFPFTIIDGNEKHNNEVLSIFIHILNTQLKSDFKG